MTTYKCKVCGGQELTLRSTSNWDYVNQEFELNAIDPEYRAYCDECGDYVDWDTKEDVCKNNIYI
jgi:hypothetical protein